MGFLGTVLYFVIILAIMFGVMILGRKYLFSKVRINKFIPLGISVTLMVFQLFMPAILGSVNVILSFVLTIVTLFFFIWFLDIQTTGGPRKKEKEIKIVPKAKPNRVKHLNKDKK